MLVGYHPGGGVTLRQESPRWDAISNTEQLLESTCQAEFDKDLSIVNDPPTYVVVSQH
jgi:hypothetical protein